MIPCGDMRQSFTDALDLLSRCGIFVQGLRNISAALDSMNSMRGQLDRLMAETSARQVSTSSVLFFC